MSSAVETDLNIDSQKRSRLQPVLSDAEGLELTIEIINR